MDVDVELEVDCFMLPVVTLLVPFSFIVFAVELFVLSLSCAVELIVGLSMAELLVDRFLVDVVSL